MRIKVLLLVILFFTVCSCDSNELSDIDSSFWATTAEFEDNIYQNKELSLVNFEKMKLLANSLDSKLVKMELFIRKLQLIEAYDQPIDIVNHFKGDFEVIPDTHASYLNLLFKNYKALKALDDNRSISKIRNELNGEPRKIFRVYSLLIDLNGNRDEDIYKKLMNTCESFCNFSDYYLVLLDFYYKNGKPEELKELATNLLDQVMLKEYMPSEPFFLQYLYAYLSVVTAHSGDKNTSIELKKLALSGMSKSLNKFKELKKIIDSK